MRFYNDFGIIVSLDKREVGILLAIKALNVTKVFRREKNDLIYAVNNVSFEVEEGEIFGILGPNGSGKSTLIRLISTLLIPDSGTIEVFGKDVVKEAHEVRKYIHRVSAEAGLFKKLSAYENLLFSAGIYGLSKKEAYEKINEIASLIGLDKKRLNDPIEQFSRGMQQKVSIARAFLTQPKLLLLDEPTTGLDPRAKLEVHALIRKANKQGSTILLSTHDMNEAYELCDRVMIIFNGRIVVIGDPKELVRNMREKYQDATLETVFLEYTGYDFSEVDVEEVG